MSKGKLRSERFVKTTKSPKWGNNDSYGMARAVYNHVERDAAYRELTEKIKRLDRELSKLELSAKNSSLKKNLKKVQYINKF